MTTANQPENPKTQGSLSDLGQISTEHANPEKHDAIARAVIKTCYSRTEAVHYLAYLLDMLTSSSKADREFAKKKVRELHKKGQQL